MPELIPRDRENNEKLHVRVGNVRYMQRKEKLTAYKNLFLKTAKTMPAVNSVVVSTANQSPNRV